MSALEAVRRGADGVVWFVKGVLGEDAYDRYRSHHESTHGSEHPSSMMTEREFWRDYMDRQDANPGGRCC